MEDIEARKREFDKLNPFVYPDPPVERSAQSRETYIISSEIDGSALRKEKVAHPRYIRAKGSHDEQDINEAICDRHNKQFSIPAYIWERIFGGER